MLCVWFSSNFQFIKKQHCDDLGKEIFSQTSWRMRTIINRSKRHPLNTLLHKTNKPWNFYTPWYRWILNQANPLVPNFLYTHTEHSVMLKHWISHTKISALLQSYLNGSVLQTTKAFNSSAKGLMEEPLYKIKI
jgi:hypothetical protein